MKIEHLLVEGVVHRMITSTLGHVTVSCDLQCAAIALEHISISYDLQCVTTDPLTCFPCLVCDEEALRRKLKRQLMARRETSAGAGPRYGLCIDCRAVHPYDEECS